MWLGSQRLPYAPTSHLAVFSSHDFIHFLLLMVYMLKEAKTDVLGLDYVPQMNTDFKNTYHKVEKSRPHTDVMHRFIPHDAYQKLWHVVCYQPWSWYLYSVWSCTLMVGLVSCLIPTMWTNRQNRASTLVTQFCHLCILFLFMHHFLHEISFVLDIRVREIER